MSDTVQFPLAQMGEKARTMQNQTTSLTEETSSHIQQLQQHHSNLPTSMQGSFGDFISGMQQRLSKLIETKYHILLLAW